MIEALELRKEGAVEDVNLLEAKEEVPRVIKEVDAGDDEAAVEVDTVGMLEEGERDDTEE